METQITPDLIDGHLNQQLTVEEEKAFQEQCNHDAALMEEVRKMKVIAAGVREAGRRRTLSMLQNYEKELGGSKVIGFKPIWKWASGFAAALLIAIPAFLLFGGEGPLAPPNELYAGDVRRGGNNASSSFVNGIDEYNNGNYSAAADTFSAITSDKTHGFKASYYLGLCLMQDGKWKEAKEAFDSSALPNEHELFDDLQYYSGVACYRLEDWDCVKEKLKPLEKNKEFGKKATKILSWEKS